MNRCKIERIKRIYVRSRIVLLWALLVLFVLAMSL